jgi:hypothetical protein
MKISELSGIIKNVSAKGLLYMVGAGSLNKILAFSYTVFLVRILDKHDYGIYGYVMNIIAMFMIFDGLGGNNAYLQFGSAASSVHEREAYFRYNKRRGIIADLCMSVVIVGYAYFLIPDTEAGKLLMLAAFLPASAYLLSLFQIDNIVRRNNRTYSWLMTFNAAILMAGTLVGAYLWGPVGMIVMRYLATGISVICASIMCRRPSAVRVDGLPRLQVTEKRQFDKFALITMCNNGISAMTGMIDIYLIGLIMDDMYAVADYRTASIIPMALLFISSTLMTFLYPYFAEKKEDPVWVRHNYIRLLKIIIPFFLILSVSLILVGPFLIPLVFGDRYTDSVPLFTIICCGLFFATAFKIPAGNLIAAMGKVKINFYIAVGSGLFNILSSVILITSLGLYGAAISYMGILMLTGITNTICMFRLLKRR